MCMNRPRTFLGSLRANERTPNVSDSYFGWIKDFYAIPDTWILNHHTLDGFLFLRFLKVRRNGFAIV
jgi:calcium permeable stress-gated cation channel